MKNLLAIVAFAVILAGCDNKSESQSQAQLPPHLQFGAHKWSISFGVDSVIMGEGYIDSSGNPASKQLAPVVYMSDTTIHEYLVNPPIVDTVIQINPITLEEETVIIKLDTLVYNIDGGKLFADDMKKQLTDRFAVSDSALKPYYIEILVVGNGRYLNSFHQYSNDKDGPYVAPDILKGDRVILQFTTIAGEKHQPIKGIVLFEII